MKQKLLIKVEPVANGHQIEFSKGRNSLLHGDGYNRRQSAEKTAVSTVAAIISGNYTARGIEKLWCDEHDDRKLFEFEVDGSYETHCPSCRADEAAEEIAPIEVHDEEI